MPESGGGQTFARWMMEACGAYSQAVEAALAFSRTAWRCAFDDPAERLPGRAGAQFCVVREAVLREQAARALAPFTNQAPALVSEIVEHLSHSRPVRIVKADGSLNLAFSMLLPVEIARALLAGVRADHELRFFVARAIRRHYRCVLSSRAADLFHLLADRVNSLAGEDGDRPRRRIKYKTEFLPHLEAAIAPRTATWDDAGAAIALFVECCRMVNYLQPDYEFGKIVVRAQNFDAEFLMSRLFGVPTGIDGFDELFGGGGIILVDDIEPAFTGQIRGRTVLVLGRYATGKSLLALEMAVAVAAKGGAAWVMPLEQSAEECLYALRSMCKPPHDIPIAIATDPVSARAYLKDYQPGRGVLIFLRTIKESFELFLANFQENVEAMQAYPMRLLVVDPINALHREDPAQVNRGNMLRMFEQAKNSGTNVWLIGEESSHFDDQALYEQNIADTVIHLSLKEKYGDVQRYLEISKSRLQREQRGKHPYSIVSGQGIAVYPSSAAVSERVASRRTRPASEAVEFRFGFEPLHDILGPDAIRPGDTIVLEGPAGAMKTPLGLMFLLHESRGREKPPEDAIMPPDARIHNLLFAARDDDTTVQWLLDQEYIRRHKVEFEKKGKLQICALRGGFVQPGYILQRIKREFLNARLHQREPDRVMVDNVGHWETSCPYLREDPTFGDTLVDLLRRNNVTSLLTCSRVSDRRSPSLQQAIIDNADCVIQFERIQFRGSYRVVLRVLKTRSMRHRKDSFELVLTPEGLDLKPTSSLLRVLRGGEVAPVNIRLFLHSETDMQEEYNQSVLHMVRSVLSRNTKMDSQRRIYMEDALALAASSAIDEMQLVQLDEFQVPRAGAGGPAILQSFAMSAVDAGDWEGYFGRFVPGGGSCESFSVLPLYENVSLLAYRRDRLESPEAVASWTTLAEECRRWEADHPDCNELFFEFPAGSPENYNCLFLEILLAMSGPPEAAGSCRLEDWLLSPNAITAATLFRTLCRRAYLAAPEARPHALFGAAPIQMSPKAVVWRTWYSTLNQLLSKLPAKERLTIEVVPLPDKVSISGEWYVGVPAHSAAPDIGLKLMKFLTSREADLDRVKLGVGLPARASFYRSRHAALKTRVSPYFSMNLDVLGRLVETAFARSSFDCYSHVSGVLSAHLQSVIEVEDDQTAEQDIRLIFESLEEKIGFMRQHRGCNHAGGCGPARHTEEKPVLPALKPLS